MSDLAAFARRLPKVQLHCHLEGTVRAETFRDLAGHYGFESERTRGALAATYDFTDFSAFLLTFADVCRTLREPADFARIAREYATDAAAQNVRYAEVFISPAAWRKLHAALDVEETVAAIREVFDAERERGGVDVALICDLTRNFGAEEAFATARTAVSLAEAGLGVIGIGLGGDEAHFPASLFADSFAFARAHGLRAVAHAGEAAGPQSVRDAVEVLGAERIGHGVRAVEEPAVVSLLVERGIALELCPTSNRLTGAVPARTPHPIGAFDAAGVVCTVDADDPALFSTSIEQEYQLVGSWLGPETLARFARNAIDASFAAQARKAQLRAELDVVLGPETLPP